MPRFPLFASAALCAALLISACTTPSDPVAGTWVEPIPGMPGKVQGFRLEADGGASSVNMATLTTERWKREGDRLILEGRASETVNDRVPRRVDGARIGRGAQASQRRRRRAGPRAREMIGP